MNPFQDSARAGYSGAGGWGVVNCDIPRCSAPTKEHREGNSDDSERRLLEPRTIPEPVNTNRLTYPEKEKKLKERQIHKEHTMQKGKASSSSHQWCDEGSQLERNWFLDSLPQHGKHTLALPL